MARLGLLVGAATFILWVYCLVSVITSREDEVRHLPKIAWLLLVLLFPLVGSIVWLAVGRPGSAPRRQSAWGRPMPAFPEYDRPGRAAATDPAADEEFLRKVRARAEEQRRRERERRLAEERRREREERGDTAPQADPS